MSNSCWIHWIEYLLFGSSSIIPNAPLEFKNLILRMEAENIPWSHIVLQGGFTAFPYQVHGDLNYLIDHLEKQWADQEDTYEPCLFKTRAVTKFWNQLKLLLAKRDENTLPPLPTPSLRDDDTLKKLLEPGYQGPYEYESASFWGEVARRFIQLRRPETLVSPLPKTSSEFQKRILQLYDMTCVAQGQDFDPFTLRLIHYSEYVNAAHWQSPANLEAFMRNQKNHPLTRSIQALLRRSLDELLQGEQPTAILYHCPRLNALLHNIQVIHQSVTQVPHEEAPPKLIDIFQRLLALCHRDALWEKKISDMEPRDPFIGTSLLYLTEQLRIAERERRVLWKSISEVSDPERPERICSHSFCGGNTLCPSLSRQERRTFQHS